MRKLARAGSGLAIAATLILSACGQARHISPAPRTTPTTPTPPTSRRFIDWGEPGMASPNLQIKPEYGVPYFLSTQGFAEAEFWQIANSLGPVAGPSS